jgi:protein-disulfide isomerase
MNASKAAVAAGKQGKGWEMHDELFKISSNLSLDEIKKVAEKLGLDAKKFEADMNSPETDKLIQDDLSVARATGVSGTPTFFINGKMVTNRSFEGMKAMVEEELKNAKRAN